MIRPKRGLTVAQVAAHYDELDRFYRELWGEHVHHGLWETGEEAPEEAVRRLVGVVAEQARLRPGQVVCDVGCGYGATARMLAREWGVRVTGLSVSEAQLAYARAQGEGAEGPEYLLRDWLHSGLPEGCFDAVVAIESTEHMEDKAGLFREAWRVLRPGGRMVVCAWLAGEAARAWEVEWLLEPICREGRLPGLGTAVEYQLLMAQAGLVAEHYRDVTQQVKRTWVLCLERTARGLLRERSYREWLLRGGSSNRVFALTLARMWAAYELGCLRYGIFSARRA